MSLSSQHLFSISLIVVAPREQGLEKNSQAISEALEAANLFIVPLDNERCWYRYHHLFADLLRQQLHQQQPDNVADLPIRASAWYKKWPGDRSFAP